MFSDAVLRLDSDWLNAVRPYPYQQQSAHNKTGVFQTSIHE